MTLKLDSKIPEFSVKATSSVTVSEASFRDQNTVFYFYPKDSTPGCTTESQDFTALFPEFLDLNCQIFGVSRDSLKSHENFKAKHTMPFELISDSEETLCTIFDVLKVKNMYGKQVRGIERSTFLINSQGYLIAEWRKVKVPGHVQEVLEHLKSR